MSTRTIVHTIQAYDRLRKAVTYEKTKMRSSDDVIIEKSKSSYKKQG